VASSSLVVRNLSALATTITSLYTAPPDKIRGVSDTGGWFGPLQPVRPMAPINTEPRRWDYQQGLNLYITPRIDVPFDAHELRAFANYDLFRVILENVKDQLSPLPLNVRLRRMPGESAKDYASRKPDPGIVDTISHFIDHPNPEQTRAEFTRQVLEDMLVLDAASVLKRKTKKGQLVELRPIDGGTILRYVDDNGYTPMLPSPAYAQVIKGFPAVELNTSQLLYSPRNLPTNRLYGMPPTEQSIRWLRIGIERLKFREAAYTEGSIPDALQIVPKGASPDKIKETQDWMISDLAGQIAKRRQLRLIQGFTEDGKDQIIFPKQNLLTDPYDEIEIRFFCFLLGQSPQRLLKQVNRASAEAGQDSAEKEGLEPYVDWLENSIWNRIIFYDLGFPEYEATYQQDSDVDPVKQAEIDKSYNSTGVKTINESREDLGLDPRPEPECNEPMIITATGPVPISMASRVAAASAMSDAMGNNDDDQPGADDSSSRGNGEKKPGAANAPKKKVSKSQRIAHAPRIDPARETHATTQAKVKIAGHLKKVFADQRGKAVQAAHEYLKGKNIKKAADETDPDWDPTEFAELLYESIASYWENVPAEIVPALTEAILSGVSDGTLQLEISDSNMIAAVNTIARDWASKRGAEMVGMKWNGAGELVENPNAEWVISDTTRDELRQIVESAFGQETSMSDLITQIADAGVFSDARAEMIARTEVTNAQVQGNFDVWKKSGLVNKVTWLVSADEPCDICLLNDGEERELGKMFPSGEEMPPQHPNCQCALVASTFEE
jgi:hypothetical protein